MPRANFRFLIALLVSLIGHLSFFVPALLADRPPPHRSPPITARLLPPVETPLSSVPLKLPAPPKTQAARPKPTPTVNGPAPKTPANWTQAVKQHLKKLQEQGLFYPQEAIARGQEGEVLVLMMLDESGKVVASRVEQGSGFPLLDEAALRAVRSLQSLPADAPRQTLLPVRFRLRQ